MEEKQHLDWDARQNELKALLDKYRSKNGGFDCIVPCSGGKDGSYVSYTLKHKYDMNPLTVTVRPALSLEIGDKNLYNFIKSGYNHIHISPDPNVMQILNKYGFIEKGFPYYGWLIAIHTAVIRTAFNFNIPLLFYGEDGEIEYGGSTENKNRATYDIEYMKRVYLEGGYEKVLDKGIQDGLITEQDCYFFRFPLDKDVKEKELTFTHWSYYENWDPYRNYLIAKDFCGLAEKDDTNTGTFTNFAQNDQALYSLHAYMMYLKFGFGRATQDAGIEIRRGAMVRDQAINLVNVYDNQYPEPFIETYLDYYKMTQEEFDAVLDKWVNRKIFQKVDGRWNPLFKVGEDFFYE
ncbi:flagellin modification protein, PseA [Spirochaetia bacterium]|nr:flagellin modification protein, PseA [Spirochaetia bacterium]